MIRSLRMRMFWGATTASVAVLAILGIGIDLAVRRVLWAQFDSTLMQKARALASMVEQQGGEVHFDYQRSQFSEFEPAPHPAYFDIRLNGKIFRQAASMAPGSHLVEEESNSADAETFVLPDGLKGRLLRWHFQPFVETPEAGTDPVREYPRPNGVVIVAQNSVELDHTLTRVRTLIFGLCGMAAFVVGGVMFLVARRTMRPVQRLANQIELLGPAELNKLIPLEGLPAELMPVVDRLNHLLGRVSDAFNRERMFTADVAHELRTPLAGMLTTLEVSQSRIREPAAYRASIDQCVGVLHQMEGLVERLLLLARAEGGQLDVRKECVNLEALALECWMAYGMRAGERQLTFSVDTQENHSVHADAQLLEMVFKNLMDNAVSYGKPGTSVRLVVRSQGSRVVAQLISQGHGLSREDLDHVFDRFWRKDKARSRAEHHVGLGLSLCQRLLKLQEGNLTVQLEGDTFIARMDLPLGTRQDQPVPSASDLGKQ